MPKLTRPIFLPGLLLGLVAACGTTPDSTAVDASDTADPDTVVNDTGDAADDARDDVPDDAPDAPTGCTGATPLCSYNCGGDAFEGADCIDDRWVCPAGTTPVDDCPAGSCFGLPMTGEVCDDGWQCRPWETGALPECGADGAFVCASCNGFDEARAVRRGCECTCDGGTVTCPLEASRCVTTSESSLPGARLEVVEAEDCTFTLAEAAVGITFQTRLTVDAPIAGVSARPLDAGGCDGPLDRGVQIAPFVTIFGGEQRWCICDEGLCMAPDPTLVAVESANITQEYRWNGVNWTGPSDFGNPEGPPFPPGDYVIEVRAEGEFDRGANALPEPYTMVGTMQITLVE